MRFSITLILSTTYGDLCPFYAKFRLEKQAGAIQTAHPEYREKFTPINSAVSDAQKFLERTKDEVLASLNQTSGNEFFNGGQLNIKQLSTSNLAIATLINARLEDRIRQTNLKIANMLVGIVSLVLVACYLFCGIYLALSRDLNQLVDVVERSAAGDLRQKITSHGKDELAQLTNAVGRMTLSLNGMVGNIRASADTVGSIAMEIHSENSDLASRTEKQAASLQKTANSIEQLTASVTENANNLALANRLIDASSEHVQHGLRVMEETIRSMEIVTTDTGKIAEIIGVMDGIAFQTNLLALNAAVEAARAGAEGRGFAVVATEVRNLAQKSADAAKEIKVLIATSGEAVDNGNNMINAAGKAMTEIAGTAAQVNRLIQQIANASQEQSLGIADVNQAIAEIDRITQHNAALVEQATASTSTLEEQAASLSAAVSVFRTGEAQQAGNHLHLASAATRHAYRQTSLAIRKVKKTSNSLV